MHSNFFDKFKADITKRQRPLSDRLPSGERPSNSRNMNTLEAEFHQIAFGPIHQKRSEQETTHRKTGTTLGKASSHTRDFSSPTNSIWQRWGLALVNFLTGQQAFSIREKRLKTGESKWIVYDSRSDTRRVFDSEAAVRSWLEQRYYR